MYKLAMLLFCSLVFTQHGVVAQKAVYEALKKHGLDTGLLNPKMANNALLYPHQMTRVVVTENGTKTYVSRYDPSKTDLQRWQLLSVNGKPPSKKEVKNFDREHVYRADYRIDSATLKVIRDDEKQLLIGYQYDPASLDSDHSFLKDCQFTFVINTETGVLERITQKNLKELKVKIVKMPKLTGESVFKFSSKHGNYLIVQQEVVAVMRLAGSQTSLITTDKYEYDDF